MLPFDNLNGDPGQDYFADAIAENITTELSRFRELFVISRNSAFTYKGKAVKVQAVGREAFHQAKLATARFYMTRVLPQTSGLFAAINAGAKPIMAVEEDWF